MINFDRLDQRIRKARRSLERLSRRLRCKLKDGSRILVLGDSHLGAFEFISDYDLLAPNLVRTVMVTGATAYGLNKDTASTSAFQIYVDALKKNSSSDVVVYMLGEVDCNVLYWLKSATSGLPPESWILESLKGLKRLLLAGKSVNPEARHVLTGAHLPTISDEHIHLQTHPLRRQVSATLYERTQIVLVFNDAVRQLAEEIGCHYLEIAESILDVQSKIVRDEFRLEGVIDHHLNDRMAAPLWAEKLVHLIQ